MTRVIDTGTEDLLVSVTNHVATITLNRPERRNAMSDALSLALRDQLLAVEADSDVRVVVITGAGRGFCAGGDVTSMAGRLGPASGKTQDELVTLLQRVQEQVSLRLYDMRKPTIAALPGAAAGAGMSLALACDLRLATENAFILPAFGAIGLSGDYGGSWYLSNLIGPGRAKEVYFRNRRVLAEEAKTLGVFNEVWPEDGFLDAVQAYAAEMAKGAPVALRYMKENHNRAARSDLKTTMAMEADRMVRAMHTEDFANASAAFLAKKTPEFKGR